MPACLLLSKRNDSSYSLYSYRFFTNFNIMITETKKMRSKASYVVHTFAAKSQSASQNPSGATGRLDDKLLTDIQYIFVIALNLLIDDDVKLIMRNQNDQKKK